MNQSGLNSANDYHVRGTFLGGVLGIIFHIERDLLAFVQCFESFDLDSGEMHKNVISTLSARPPSRTGGSAICRYCLAV